MSLGAGGGGIPAYAGMTWVGGGNDGWGVGMTVGSGNDGGRFAMWEGAPCAYRSGA